MTTEATPAALRFSDQLGAFDDWWRAAVVFGFGTRWLEPLARPLARRAWDASKTEYATACVLLERDRCKLVVQMNQSRCGHKGEGAATTGTFAIKMISEIESGKDYSYLLTAVR
jgi:hypothetical protein